MKSKHAILVTLITTAVLTSGCANTYSQPDTRQSYSRPAATQTHARSFGVIDSIEVIRGTETGMTGALIGGVIGGVLGNQVGSGRGNTAATIAGAAGGAVVGHEIEKNRQAKDSYQIRVRLNNGRYQTLTQDSITDLHVGNRVRIEDGRVYRN